MSISVAPQVSRRKAVTAVAVATVCSPCRISTIQCWVDRLVRAGRACDMERAVGQRGGEVHGESDRLAQPRGCSSTRIERLRGGDAAERADHVGVGRTGVALPQILALVREGDRGIEGVRAHWVTSALRAAVL